MVASAARALISIAIGIVNSTVKKFQSYVDVLTTARDYRDLAQQHLGSSGSRTRARRPCPAAGRADRRHHRTSIDRTTASSWSSRTAPWGLFAAKTLALEGYYGQVTSSADDALELARYEPHPDLILLESNLTGPRDGRLETLPRLKSDES